jgi:hypothetical protein
MAYPLYFLVLVSLFQRPKPKHVNVSQNQLSGESKLNANDVCLLLWTTLHHRELWSQDFFGVYIVCCIKY